MNNNQRKTETDSKRSKRIFLRVNASELKRIRSRARKAGISVSAYMRNAALRHPKTCTVIEVDADGLRKAYADLKHAGSNINQCARALNTYGSDALPASTVVSAARRVGDAAGAIADVLAAARGVGGAR